MNSSESSKKTLQYETRTGIVHGQGTKNFSKLKIW